MSLAQMLTGSWRSPIGYIYYHHRLPGDPPSKDPWVPVASGWVKVAGEWKLFWPESNSVFIGIQTITVPQYCGEGASPNATITGGTYSGDAPPSDGLVSLEYRERWGEWTPLAGSFPIQADGSWTATFNVPGAGPVEYRAVYTSPSASYADSVSSADTASTLLKAPVITGSTITDTSLRITWAPKPCVDRYTILLDGLPYDTTQVSTYTFTGLEPATSYVIQVMADSGPTYATSSPPSNPITGTTSSSAVLDTGTQVVDLPVYITDSYRNDLGWGNISPNLSQGYFSNPGSAYTGVIDYGGYNRIHAHMSNALGPKGKDRFEKGSATAASIYLYKMTGVGSSGAVTVTFGTTNIDVGEGNVRPTVSNLQNITSSASGAGKEYVVNAAIHEKIWKGLVRSVAIQRDNSTDYCRFSGGNSSTQNGRMRLTWTWNYYVTTSTPGGWS